MTIHGSDINLAALSEVESLADLKRLNIFSHLPDEDQANRDLWKTLHPEPELTDDSPEGDD